MQNWKSKIAAYLAKELDLYRRRRLKVRVVATTRDEFNVLRDYKVVAVPRTLERKEYDVRIKRRRRDGDNVEILERVWGRDELERFVHANN